MSVNPPSRPSLVRRATRPRIQTDEALEKVREAHAARTAHARRQKPRLPHVSAAFAVAVGHFCLPPFGHLS